MCLGVVKGELDGGVELVAVHYELLQLLLRPLPDKEDVINESPTQMHCCSDCSLICTGENTFHQIDYSKVAKTTKGDLVKLNVGGKRMDTSRATLCSEPRSMLVEFHNYVA